MNPKEILMGFQLKLKTMKGSCPQLSGPLEKYHPLNQSNLVETKVHRTQHFRNVFDESECVMDYCKRPSSSAVVVKYCPNCTCNNCQEQTSGDGLLNSTVASLFEMHEQHLQALRQQFQDSIIPILSDIIRRSPPRSLDQKIHTESSLEDLRSFQKESFLAELNLTKKKISDCMAESSVKSPDTSSILEQRVVENHSSSLLMPSRSDINDDDVNEDNEYISFASGSQCRPLRRSIQKRRKEESTEKKKSRESFSEVVCYGVPVKHCEIKLVDIMKTSAKQPVPISSSTAEEASFLQDLSIINKKPTSMKPRRAVMETGRTRSGRTTQAPKQYWITEHKKNEDEIQNSKRIQSKDKSVTKVPPKNAEKISSGCGKTCPDNSHEQVLLKRDTAARLKRSVKVSLEPGDFALHKKGTENFNDIPIKKRKKTGPSKEIESVSNMASNIVSKPPAKSKAKCRSNLGRNGVSKPDVNIQACLGPMEQPKDTGDTLTTNDKGKKPLLQVSKKRGRPKTKHINAEPKGQEENVSISEAQYECYFRKRN